jgi:hypothetical protein
MFSEEPGDVEIQNVVFDTKDLRKWYAGVWTGSSWLRIGTGDGQL